jgi:hypothetical protein
MKQTLTLILAALILIPTLASARGDGGMGISATFDRRHPDRSGTRVTPPASAVSAPASTASTPAASVPVEKK